MLVDFSVTNFRSIKEKQTLSMLPSERVKSEHRKNALHSVSNYNEFSLLTVAVINGKNGAGKSNFVKTFKAIEWLVLRSHTFTLGNKLLANEYFEFDTSTQKQPTQFEIDFIANDKKRYLFIVEFTRDEIIREELHYYINSPTGKTTKRKLYKRKNGQSIDFGEDFKGDKKIRVLNNVLFLSKSIFEADAFLIPVFEFFKEGFDRPDFSSKGEIDFRTRYFGKIASDKEDNHLDNLNSVLKNIDSGILELVIEKTDNLPKSIRFDEKNDDNLNEEERGRREELLNILKTEIKAKHRLFQENKEVGVTTISLNEESEGTQKFIAVYTSILKIIENGSLFIIDEFEKSFHPLLTQLLISLIHNPKVNTKGAQLIFTSHDPNILDFLDLDQINFVEKDNTGASEIFTLSDIRGLRHDIKPSKPYLRGEFEGIPTINYSSIHNNLEYYAKKQAS